MAGDIPEDAGRIPRGGYQGRGDRVWRAKDISERSFSASLRDLLTVANKDLSVRNPVAECADGRLLCPEKDRFAASGRPTTVLDSPMAANTQTVGLDLRARSLWLVPGWALVLCIVFLSVAPISIETGVEQGDKLSHAFAYGTLMVWFANLYGRLTGRRMFAAGFVTRGIALEFLQGWTGYRAFEVADMGADAAGVAAGWACAPPRMPNVLKGPSSQRR